MTDLLHTNALRQLLEDGIRDLFSATCQTANTMSGLGTRAPTKLLREFFTAQEESSVGRKERLTKAAWLLGVDPTSGECGAMRKLIEGGDRHVRASEGTTINELIVVAHVNRIVLYHIAGYEFAHQLASRLGFAEAAELLSISLEEACEAAGTLAGFSAGFFSHLGK